MSLGRVAVALTLLAAWTSCDQQGAFSAQLSSNFITASPELEDYLDFLAQEHDGDFVIESSGVSAAESYPEGRHQLLMAGMSKPVLGLLEVGYLRRQPSAQNQYSYGQPFPQDRHEARNLFGTDVPFRLLDPQGAVELQDTLYLPQEIELLRLSEWSSRDQEGVVDFQAGNTLYWNEDPRSEGVIVMLEYTPGSWYSGNEAFQAAGYTEQIQWGKFVPDNGSYTFQAADFVDFPVGCIVDVWLIRGTFKSVTGALTGNSYGLLGFTRSQPWFGCRIRR